MTRNRNSSPHPSGGAAHHQFELTGGQIADGLGEDLAASKQHDVGYGLAEKDQFAREARELAGTYLREANALTESAYHSSQARLVLAEVTARANTNQVNLLQTVVRGGIDSRGNSNLGVAEHRGSFQVE